jgi:hypothetical protein
MVLNFSTMSDWIQLIISSNGSLGISLVDCHKFQIFISVTYDILWFYKNKIFHNGITFDVGNVFAHINKITL